MVDGWCCYDGELADPAHVAALRRLQPRTVRWFCSIDRHVRGLNPGVDWASRYGRAFDALAAVGTTLCVQWQMKRPDWTAGDAGNTIGAASWRQSRTCGWLSDTGTKAWVSLVTALAAEVAGHGLDAIYGAWNEPDWRLDWPWNRVAGGNALAPTVPWEEGRWFGIFPVPPSAPFGWSGGHQQLAELRGKVPLRWTSDGVGPMSADWLRLTAGDPTISVIDVHMYTGGRNQDAVAYVDRVVSAFDAARPDRLPVVIGEWGDDANGSAFSPSWQARTDQLTAALSDRYQDRLLGVCAHLQGTRGGTTYPPLWRVL